MAKTSKMNNMKKSYQSWVGKTETPYVKADVKKELTAMRVNEWREMETKFKLEYVNHSDKHQHIQLSYLRI